MSHWTLFQILFTLVVICKERLLHENKIVQNLLNYKGQDINRGHFRNPPPGGSTLEVLPNGYP